MEEHLESSVQSEILDGLASASKFIGNAVAKVPFISKSQLDEGLIGAENKLRTHGKQRAISTLSTLTQIRMDVTVPFVENIRTVNQLYNKPIRYLIDQDNIYMQPMAI